MSWFKLDDNKKYSTYPVCDYLNNALILLKENKVKEAMNEIVWAIRKAGGYFYDCNKEFDKKEK